MKYLLAFKRGNSYRKGILRARIKKLITHCRHHRNDFQNLEKLVSYVGALAFLESICPVEIYLSCLGESFTRTADESPGRVIIPDAVLNLKHRPAFDSRFIDSIEISAIRYQLSQLEILSSVSGRKPRLPECISLSEDFDGFGRMVDRLIQNDDPESFLASCQHISHEDLSTLANKIIELSMKVNALKNADFFRTQGISRS